jgi:hypothetical protein
MRHDDDTRNPLNNTLNAVPTDETAAPAAGPIPVPVPVPGGDALTDPAMASFAPADATAGTGLGDVFKEMVVRGSISDEENELTRDHHLGHKVTGRLDEAVDAPDHSVIREEEALPVRGR